MGSGGAARASPGLAKSLPVLPGPGLGQGPALPQRVPRSQQSSARMSPASPSRDTRVIRVKRGRGEGALGPSCG